MKIMVDGETVLLNKSTYKRIKKLGLSIRLHRRKMTNTYAYLIWGWKRKGKLAKKLHKKYGSTIYLHRFALKANRDGRHVDHVDGNSLNNLVSNLRLVSQADNAKNRLYDCLKICCKYGFLMPKYRNKQGTWIHLGKCNTLDECIAIIAKNKTSILKSLHG